LIRSHNGYDLDLPTLEGDLRLLAFGEQGRLTLRKEGEKTEEEQNAGEEQDTGKKREAEEELEGKEEGDAGEESAIIRNHRALMAARQKTIVGSLLSRNYCRI